MISRKYYDVIYRRQLSIANQVVTAYPTFSIIMPTQENMRVTVVFPDGLKAGIHQSSALEIHRMIKEQEANEVVS